MLHLVGQLLKYPRHVFKHTTPPCVISVCDVMYVSSIFYYVPPIYVLVYTMVSFHRHLKLAVSTLVFPAIIILAVQTVNLLVT